MSGSLLLFGNNDRGGIVLGDKTKHPHLNFVKRKSVIIMIFNLEIKKLKYQITHAESHLQPSLNACQWKHSRRT